ncbi:site-specific integrase [Muricoccus nepalensis]|uniref:site-specific integrase n=1 Tax=Muricoccus nepalensis TaxID=1854500 RepID=UPI0013873B1F|nr:site-specific integrase [Roseomonas nepalensis]
MPKYTRVRTASDLFPVHVVDQDGLPHVELTAYACRSPRHHSPRTAYAYTSEVVAFASRAESDFEVQRQGWRLLGSPEEARRVVSHVLAVEMRCALMVARDRLGFQTCSVKPTWQTGRGLERLLAALRSFYAVLQLHGFYPHANPMEAAGARAAIEAEARAEAEAFRRAHGRERMPLESGVDAPLPAAERRSSAAYFRLRGERWLPTLLDDPALMNDVLAAGERWGWSLREMALVRVLFDAGPRVGEACSLTLADWRPSGFLREVLACNKGSLGRRTKRLILGDRTVKVLRRYVDEERSRLDPRGRGLADFRRADAAELTGEPLFLTAAGTALDSDHFRRNFWTPALRASGISLRCHQVRHWYVTQALSALAAGARSEAQLVHDRQAFRELMAWRTNMLPVYDQAIRRHDLPRTAARIHAWIDRRGRRPAARKEGGSGARGTVPLGLASSEAAAMLDEMLSGGGEPRPRP